MTIDESLGADGGACPASAETDLCFKCGDESCCTEYARYQGSAEGRTYRDCLIGCTDTYSECVRACDEVSHGGHIAFAPYLACSEYRCYDECAPPPGPCDECLVRACALERYRCALQADCDTLLACTGECSSILSESCTLACEESATGATVRLFHEFLDCGATQCSVECG